MLAGGTLLNGVRPFKATVDTPQFDEPVPSALTTVSIDFSGLTIREATEKLYDSQISIGKALDNNMMILQMDELRSEISEEAFTAACTVNILSKSACVPVKRSASASASKVQSRRGLLTRRT